MKYLIALLALGSVLGLNSVAQATVFEINDQEMKVYIHPTPTMEMTLQDLDSEGGILYLNLTYDGKSTKQEISDLQSQYPNYEIQALTARQNGNVSVRIADIVQHDFQAYQQQLGPQINTQLRLSQDQVSRLKALGSKLASLTEMLVPAKVSFMHTQLLERYELSPDICMTLNARTVQDLVVNLGHLEKPEGIKFDETFTKVKTQLLSQCFSVLQQRVESFQQLLSLRLNTLQPTAPLVGEAFKKQEVTKTISLKPLLTFDSI